MTAGIKLSKLEMTVRIISEKIVYVFYSFLNGKLLFPTSFYHYLNKTVLPMQILQNQKISFFRLLKYILIFILTEFPLDALNPSRINRMCSWLTKISVYPTQIPLHQRKYSTNNTQQILLCSIIGNLILQCIDQSKFQCW